MPAAVVVGVPVVVTFKRSARRSTSPDLTGPVRHPVRGRLLQLERGRPLLVALADGRQFQSSPIALVAWGQRVVEVTTARSVYEVRVEG